LKKKPDDAPPDADERAKAEAAAKKKFAALYDAHGQRISAAITANGGAPDAQFWQDEPAHLVRDALPFYDDTAAAAAHAGIEQLPVGVDWGLVNQSVLSLAQTEAKRFADAAVDTSRAQTSQVIADWISTGGTMPDLIDRVSRVWEGPRADVAAVTEVTRLYATGNATAWEASNVVTAMEWRTAQDDLVCPICGPLSDTEIPFGGELPPAHPNCRCWIVPVVKRKRGCRR
jgi:SPP1 gp7 family putative phage head morphogenesis protein